MSRKTICGAASVCCLGLAIAAGCGGGGAPDASTPPWDAAGSTSDGATPPPGTPLPEEVPAGFAGMLAAPVATRYYVAPEVAGASDDLDGLAPEPGGGHGPLASLDGLRGKLASGEITLAPGDAIVLRAGTYALDVSAPGGTVALNRDGRPDAPIRLMAYEGERPVLDGGFRLDAFLAETAGMSPAERADLFARRYGQRPVLRLDASWTVVQGLTLTGCGYACLLWRGSHSILIDSTIDGGVEDGIKTTYLETQDTPSSDNLVARTRFLGFGDQAIDLWGTRGMYFVQNHISSSEPTMAAASPGTPVWVKGGSRDVWLLDNAFENLRVHHNALILGGCCWNNWSSSYPADPPPVARDVHALRNRFENIDIAEVNELAGALAVQGCESCEARDNVVIRAGAGWAVYATIDNQGTGIRVPARSVTMDGNVFVDLLDARAGSVRHHPEGLSVDNNVYYQDDVLTFTLEGMPVRSLASWREATGMEVGSRREPRASWTP